MSDERPDVYAKPQSQWTPPVQYLDAAAIKATKQWIPRSSDMKSLINRGSLARIITDCYEHRMRCAEGDAKTVDRQHLEMCNILARLTAERDVREKLVKALRLSNDVIDTIRAEELRATVAGRAALAAAAELDDVFITKGITISTTDKIGSDVESGSVVTGLGAGGPKPEKLEKRDG